MDVKIYRKRWILQELLVGLHVFIRSSYQGDRAHSIGETLKSVKEQLRRIPENGIGYGLLRYLNDQESVREKIRSLPPAEVSFNYLGQTDQIKEEASGFSIANEDTGSDQDSEARRAHILDITGIIVDGELRVNWIYCQRIFRQETMDKIGAIF